MSNGVALHEPIDFQRRVIDKIVSQLSVYDRAIRELAEHNVAERARVAYEVQITPVDHKRGEVIGGAVSICHYFYFPLFEKAERTQTVSLTQDVEEYFKKSDAHSFRLDFLIRLHTPGSEGRLAPHHFMSGKLAEWNAKTLTVINPYNNTDGEANDAEGDWFVSLRFKGPTSRAEWLSAITVEHDPARCATLVAQLKDDAVAIEYGRLQSMIERLGEDMLAKSDNDLVARGFFVPALKRKKNGEENE